MTEYGYALCAKTHAAMMPVMNTAFGPPEELPFDMGHLRHPIQYNVDPTAKPAQRRAVRRALSKEFEEKLRLQIVATEPPRPAPAPFPKAEPKDGPARFRLAGEPIGNRWDSGRGTGNSISLAAGPAMWLRLMPPFDPGRPPWTSSELRDALQGGIALQPFIWSTVYTLRAEDGIGCCALDSADGRETNSVAFAFETGEVWATDTWQLGIHPAELPAPNIEEMFTQRLPEYGRFLMRLGLQPPYQWIAGLTDVKNRQLQFPSPQGQMSWRGPECLSEHIISSGTYDGKQSPTSALLLFFAEIYRKCGMPRPDYLLK